MLKKLTVALLVLLLTLGAAIAVYGGSQTVDSQISCSLSFDLPGGVTNWGMTVGTNTTTDSTVTVNSNCPYLVQVKSTTPDWSPTVTGTESDTDLAAIQVNYQQSGNLDCTSVDATNSMSSATIVTTTDDAFLTCNEAPDDGTDTFNVKLTQVITTSDPAYVGTSKITWDLTLTWTYSNSPAGV